MILLGVTAGLALPNFSETYGKIVFQKSVADLAGAMRYAQARAVSHKRAQEIQFDVSEQSYWLMQRSEDSSELSEVYEPVETRLGRKNKIPEQIKLDAQNRSIRFYTDGTMDKTRLYLTHRDQTMTISTQEQQGQVRVFDFKVE